MHIRLNNLANEDQDQDALITVLEYYKNQGKVLAFTHVANEGVYDKRKAAKGVVPGTPDLLIVTRKRTIYIELKRADGTGTVSPAQLAWIKQINKVNVDAARVCTGFDEAKAFLDANV